jgi:hypothetical protein
LSVGPDNPLPGDELRTSSKSDNVISGTKKRRSLPDLLSDGNDAGRKQMRKHGVFIAIGLMAVLALGGCGDGTPGDAAGAKVLRNLLEKTHVGAKLVSFKKTQGREVKTPDVNAYEFWYEAELQFPEDLDAKCGDEKERGKCAYLGLSTDQSFKKGEVWKSEGTLNFVKTEKGWIGEDHNAY